MARNSNTAVQDDGYIPFATRFRAWWEGVDATTLTDAKNREAVRGQSLIVDRGDQKGQTAQPGLSPDRLRLWTALWGEGYCLPGGADITESMLRPLNLKPADKLLDLSAGLGGPARAMAKRYEVKVSGLEHREPVAETGMALSREAGVADQVPVNHYNPLTFDLIGEKFDCVIARELFFQVRDKEIFLRKAMRATDEGGHFCFTDYALNDYEMSDPDLAAWAAAEHTPPQTWTLKRYKQVLDDLDANVQTFADITDTYCELAKGAWAGFTEALPRQQITQEFADWMLKDGEVWLKRTRAMEAGKLRVIRVHLERKGISLMSDW